MAKLALLGGIKGEVLPTLEKELWQSIVVITSGLSWVLPTLEKELWQLSWVLPTLEKELWQSVSGSFMVSGAVLPTLEKELWQSVV